MQNQSQLKPRGLTPWVCAQCADEQVAWGPIPADRLCHACHSAADCKPLVDVEAAAGIPDRYRGLTRESWMTHFQRPWPAALERWTGSPSWAAIWGPTGSGKTGIAAVLLAEHLRGGGRGRWISGPELARRVRHDFAAADELLEPLLFTPRLVLDEPLAGPKVDWYFQILGLLTRTRDERRLPTLVTSDLLPELLLTQKPAAPPTILSRWLSGIRIHDELSGEDVRLREAV
ncbi:MAG TPA: hypothetical protein VJ885_15780 [Thermoanaerobaculia bacterium]|nr:hypothetical protein [Thermoanaerobaculia bacterium]